MMSTEPERESPVGQMLGHVRGGPTVLRIVLGTQLRRLRTGCGISGEDAGEAIRASHAKISRLELGRVSCRERDVADLLTLYGVTDAGEREGFLALARRAGTPGWWHQYADVLPRWFEQLIGLEEAASVIRTYEVQFVPGLLQTADYARAVTRLGHPRASRREVQRRVDLRMERQDMLTRPDAPRLWAVVDEAALRRPIGGREVMRAQLEHLIHMAELPSVRLQIAPFRIGGLAAAGGAVTLLQFDLPDLSDTVYLEQLTSALYLDKREEVDGYLEAMERLREESCDPESTVEMLREILAEEYAPEAPTATRSLPHRVGAVRTASHALAGGTEQQGGDVHDVVETPFGVRVLIADVMGKGKPTVKTAARVKRAFRELASHEAKLSGVAERMHAALGHRDDVEEFVSALLVNIRKEDGVAELVCCGHPPPLLLHDTQVSYLDALPVFPPLGLLDLGGGWCESATVPFTPGDRMLLYTDGVTEARDAEGQCYPLAERATALLHEDPRIMMDALAAGLLEHVPGPLTDDAALLLVHCDHEHARGQNTVGALSQAWPGAA